MYSSSAMQPLCQYIMQVHAQTLVQVRFLCSNFLYLILSPLSVHLYTNLSLSHSLSQCILLLLLIHTVAYLPTHRYAFTHVPTHSLSHTNTHLPSSLSNFHLRSPLALTHRQVGRYSSDPDSNLYLSKSSSACTTTIYSARRLDKARPLLRSDKTFC